MSQILQNCISGTLRELPSVFTISVRYRTKPRWAPIAKTKQFRVTTQRTPLPPEEEAESMRLFNIYRTQLRATIEEIKRSYQASSTADEVIIKREKDKQDAWDECMRINDEWNAQLAIEREQRNKEIMEQRLKEAEEEMQRQDALEKAKQARIDRMIREQQELSKTFITKENIDAHIKKILDEEPYSFLWAIDVRGRIYEGYNKAPTPDKKLSVHRFLAENAHPDESETEVKAQS